MIVRPASIVLVLGLLLAGGVRAEDGRLVDPVFRAPAPGEILAAGPPPLQRTQLDAFVDLVQSAFDLSIPRAHEARLRERLVDAWSSMSVDEREAFGRLVAPRTALRQAAVDGRAADLDEGLRAFRRRLDALTAGDPSAPVSTLLREVLAMRSKIVWPGDPPLPATRAAAWMEICAFLVSIGRNQTYEPSPGQQGAVSDVLAEALAMKDAATRERLMASHRVWLRCRATWDRADAARRLQLRWIATRLVNRTLDPSRQIPLGEGVDEDDLVRWLRAAELVADATSPFEAWTNLGRNPDVVLPKLEGWLDPLPRELDEILLYR